MLKKFISLIILCCFVLTGCVTSNVPRFSYHRAKKRIFNDASIILSKPKQEYSNRFHNNENNLKKHPFRETKKITDRPPKIEQKSLSQIKSETAKMYEIIEQAERFNKRKEMPQQTKPRTISDIIAESNKQAIRVPKKESFQQSIVRYSYEEGAVFTVHCTPGFLTDIVLQKGEQIINLSAGDTANFLVKHIANDPEHVLIKPLISMVDTNLMIHTNKRNYYISLKSSEKIHMNAIAFSYPKEELEKVTAKVLKNQNRDEFKAEDLGFDFIIESACSDACLEPLSVFEDKKRGKIYIVMPEAIKHSALPAVFAIGDRDIAEMVNYRFVENKFILDTLISRLMLQYGGKNREIYIYKSGFKPKNKFDSFLNRSKSSKLNPDNHKSER